MTHIYTVVDANAPSAYWEGWWEEVDQSPHYRVLKSGRPRPAADTDVRVLEGRLASGLWGFLGWTTTRLGAFRLLSACDPEHVQ